MNQNKLPDYFICLNDGWWMVEKDRENMKLYYRVKEILSNRQSPFQHVNIIESYDFGRCLVLDGVIQTTELDGYIYNEVISHIPVVTHPDPQRVLVIGGGDCGVVNELTKYKGIDAIDLVEIDQVVVEECIGKLTKVSGNAGSDPRVSFIFTDGTKYVKDIQHVYDVAIVDSSDPIGPAEGLISEEFYADLKRCLKEDGLLFCQSQSPIFHKETVKSIRNRLEHIFPIVHTCKAVIPSYPGGMWSFTLASMKYDPFQADLTRLVANTQYINKEIFKSSFCLPNFMLEDFQE